MKSVMLRGLTLVAVGLVMAGCAAPKAAVYNPIRDGLEAMTGRDVAVAYRTLGLPDKKDVVGKKMMFVWNKTRCDVLIETGLDGVVIDSALVGKPGACKWVSEAMSSFLAREAAKTPGA